MTILLTQQDIEHIINRHMAIQSATMNGPKVKSVHVAVVDGPGGFITEATVKFQDPDHKDSQLS